MVDSERCTLKFMAEPLSMSSQALSVELYWPGLSRPFILDQAHCDFLHNHNTIQEIHMAIHISDSTRARDETRQCQGEKRRCSRNDAGYVYIQSLAKPSHIAIKSLKLLIIIFITNSPQRFYLQIITFRSIGVAKNSLIQYLWFCR